MEQRWAFKKVPDETVVADLKRSLGISQPLAQLLAHRGINDYHAAKAFFRPSLDDLHDPFFMKDMDKAVERITDALAEQQRIMVYGDYDVDGTTSVSMMYSFLIGHTDEVEFYIPDRYQEGYGLSFQGIDTAKKNGVELIITLDCGIKANEKVAYANKQGIDVIICDHHRPGEELPLAEAILDPKREDCTYPFQELSGCGVGFKLIQAFCRQNCLSEDLPLEYLDLLAVSIAADIVPITGENRVLTHFGLKKINSSPRMGFQVLLENLERKREAFTITDLVFLIGPRINAAGRIESGNKAVELLISEHEEEARESGKAINDHNDYRKDLDKRITKEALEMIEGDDSLRNGCSTVVYHEDWHKGVIGIVASRLIENHYRPTIVITESNGKFAGSARSVKGFDIYNAIQECGDLVEQFGGHKYAAGLTLEQENLEAFRERFETVVAEQITKDQLTPELELELELPLSAITNKFYRILSQFAPFGPGNMKPVFYTSSVIDTGYAKVVGKNHLKMILHQEGDAGTRIPAIGFGLGEHLDRILTGEPFHIAYTLEENHYRGKTTLQAVLKDLKFGTRSYVVETRGQYSETSRSPADQ